LPGGALDAGVLATRTLEPLPGPLDVEVQYRLRRACCPDQAVQGSRRIQGEVALTPADLAPVAVEGRTLQLRLGGTLRAHVEAEGPGSAAPAELRWGTWEPRDLALDPDRPGEAGGSRLRLRVETDFLPVLHATLTSPDGEVLEADAPAAEVPGDAAVVRAFAIRAGASQDSTDGPAGFAARAVPGPAAALVATLALAVGAAARGSVAGRPGRSRVRGK
jgi:hypothetical protein